MKNRVQMDKKTGTGSKNFYRPDDTNYKNVQKHGKCTRFVLDCVSLKPATGAAGRDVLDLFLYRG